MNTYSPASYFALTASFAACLDHDYSPHSLRVDQINWNTRNQRQRRKDRRRAFANGNRKAFG